MRQLHQAYRRSWNIFVLSLKLLLLSWLSRGEWWEKLGKIKQVLKIPVSGSVAKQAEMWLHLSYRVRCAFRSIIQENRWFSWRHIIPIWLIYWVTISSSRVSNSEGTSPALHFHFLILFNRYTHRQNLSVGVSYAIVDITSSNSCALNLFYCFPSRFKLTDLSA